MSAVTDCQSFPLPFAAYVSFNVKIQSLILVSRWNARVKASEGRASRCPGLSLVACLGGGVCTLRASWWTRLFVPKSHCSHFPQVWPRSQMLFILLYWLYVWFLTRCDCEVFNKTTHAAKRKHGVLNCMLCKVYLQHELFTNVFVIRIQTAINLNSMLY